MSLACRACRRPLTSIESCAICADMKANLVNEGEDESERPSLSDVGSEAVAGLRWILREANAAQRDRNLDARARGDASARVLKVGNTLSKVLEAARKLQTDGLAAIRNMSFIERAELFLGWYTALAPAYREKILAKMHESEARASRPAELQSGS